ncbi:MAG TPA: hypothetical protein VLM75_11440 [Spirochaetota bacterium]|nr:hypothetical protein [Spirochaetota bacterium]
MKKLMVCMMMAAMAGVVACGSGTTELQFTNSNDSIGTINDIIWAGGDQTWNSGTGYAVGTDTESKEVDARNGEVECSVDPGTGYVAADVFFPETISAALSLKEGSSNKYTLKATPL